MSTRFSVITVCYNALEALPGAVASLKSQTYTDREWVVVDGGSKDGTQDYLRGCGEPLARMVSEKDRGIYDAMNKGIALASGDVLFFLNADDAFHDPEVLAEVARHFDADPELDMLFGDVVLVKGDDRIYKRFDFINRATIRFDDLCHQVIFARKRLFDRVGDFKLDWKTSADYDWMLRVFLSGAKVKHVRRPVSFFSCGGMHVRDPQALADERWALRRQYVSRPMLELGYLVSRGVHKLSRMLTGYSYGERPVEGA